jgi:hypothetical protein
MYVHIKVTFYSAEKRRAAETLLVVVLQEIICITLEEQNVQTVLWEEEAKNDSW